MGEKQEIARQSIVDKALVDAEILFFMNDLEGVSARLYPLQMLLWSGNLIAIVLPVECWDVGGAPDPAGEATEPHGVSRPASSSSWRTRYG